MTFQLDTTGVIDMEPDEAADRGHLISWPDLDAFTQGYIEALFASEGIALATALNEQWLQQQKDRDWKLHPSWRRGWLTVGFSDLAPETLARIIADCEMRYIGWNCHANNIAVASDDRTEGVHFWKDRQASCSPTFPPLTVQLGDDGKVRFAA